MKRRACDWLYYCIVAVSVYFMVVGILNICGVHLLRFPDTYGRDGMITLLTGIIGSLFFITWDSRKRIHALEKKIATKCDEHP